MYSSTINPILFPSKQITFTSKIFNQQKEIEKFLQNELFFNNTKEEA